MEITVGGMKYTRRDDGHWYHFSSYKDWNSGYSQPRWYRLGQTTLVDALNVIAALKEVGGL